MRDLRRLNSVQLNYLFNKAFAQCESHLKLCRRIEAERDRRRGFKLPPIEYHHDNVRAFPRRVS